MSALSAVPDPRQRRGRRSAWPVLLALIAAALAGGAQGARAIRQWAAERADDLPGRLPDLLRALGRITIADAMRHDGAYPTAPRRLSTVSTGPARH